MFDSGELLRFVAAFGVIAAVLYAFAAVSRRYIGGGPSPRRGRLIDVIETVPLPHASSLHVVRLGDAHFAIGRTDGGISLLSAIEKDVIADSRSAGSSTRTNRRASSSSDSRQSPQSPQSP